MREICISYWLTKRVMVSEDRFQELQRTEFAEPLDAGLAWSLLAADENPAWDKVLQQCEDVAVTSVIAGDEVVWEE